DIDNMTAGLHNTELVIIAARPSVGKTAFALNLVRNVITEGAESGQSPVVLFFSLEMARIELAERLLCCQSRVPSHNVRKGLLNSDDIQKLMDAGDVLRKCRLYIDDTPSRTMIQIAASARRLMKKHEKDGGLKLIVIDYLQLIEPENRRDPRQEQVAQISRRLKFLARELLIPVIALAQVNRASEDRQDHKPRLSDLRESGSIEQDADTCWMLHRPGKFDGQTDDNILEIIIAKQRNGPTGEITLTWRKEYNRYENYIADVGLGEGV
ncbi:MAG TPA: DnaB-like helicase C-terminal domain-containing protein, partial [Gemmata sp.]